MLIDLKDKVAVVTGAGRGIGREIARTLATEGVTVVALDNQPELLADVGAEWTDKGYPGAQIEADIRHKDECQSAIAQAVKQFGRVDILVNNAGVASGDRVETLKEEIWDANFDINLKGTFLMCQAVVPQMKLQNWGRIINAASFAAIIPSIGSAAYASSKAGVESLTRVLASEMGPYGVTVNCYSPGMIPTQMNRYADASPERKEQLLDTLTLRRWGSPDDVAKLICFLSSDLAGYITGTMIDISGGKFATQMPWMAHRN